MTVDRVDKLKQILLSKTPAVLISSAQNISYLTGYSNFALTEREAYLLITKSNQYILTDPRYSHAIKQQVPNFELVELNTKLRFKDALRKLQTQWKLDSLGIEEENLTLKEFKLLKKIFKSFVSIDLVKQRIIKTPTEINLIETACKIGDLAFQYILNKIKPDLSEKQIAFVLESFIRQNNAEPSFETIIAFNQNTSFPHHQTGNTKLAKQSGQLILMDFGVKLNNYCSDITRVIFFGKASPELKKIYKTVYDSHQKAIEFLRRELKNSGQVKAKEVDKIARDYLISQGYPSIPHSLGHGIGLEVHERPWISYRSKDILKSGMVFSIEPGIYLPDLIGVRIEDLYSIEGNNLRQLTKAPKDIIVL